MSSDPFDAANSQSFSRDGGFRNGTPPPTKQRTWLWVLGIGAAVSLVSLIICCGVLTFGFSKMGSVFFEPIRMELNELAQVQESAGRVDKLTMNFGASTEEGQSNPGFVVLDAETADGPYQFSVKIGSEGEIEKGFLIKPDGTREELNLNDSSRAPAQVTADPTPNGTGEDAERDPGDAPLDPVEKELQDLESELEIPQP